MHSAKQKVLHFFHQFKLENFYYLLVFSIIVAILFIASFALFRPVSFSQYQQVRQLAHQAYYPSTQDMATELMKKQQVTIGHYLKLMRAYHAEQSRAKEFPALADETRR